MLFIISLLCVFLFIGIIYPTKWHKKVAYRKATLGKRSWNIALLFLCFIIVVALTPNNSKVTASKKDEQEKLAKTEADKLKQEELAKVEADKLKQEELAKVEADKLKQEELAKVEADKLKQELAKVETEKQKANVEIEKTSKENKRKQEESQKKNQTTNKPSVSPQKNSTPSNKPAYRGKGVTCSSFSSSAEATAYMNAYKVYKLDRNKNGVACEDN
ncbi:high-affinity K+ transport system ATPase subunit B [Croceifilum oryzae]|uniref:High-affinity K+ transport system ATPase subunit B n=1 Tax=Croceifilum oryzae TaxID=1553429 RepID=A0AAJ1TK96_9BACL|nr:excalibur calcium-binding domain-containing protein [Croceifilum oryzae]MDQ0417619.1 high-affinity K+ transport system ATPase subunit B [Croceifilum oryzae]